MKKFFLVTALVFIVSFAQAQMIVVPFRVGDKFGVADSKGKMIIPAAYDIVEPQEYNGNKYLIAYTLSGNSALSTLIYNNKIILKDQAYKHYYIHGGLLKASAYKVLKNSAYHSEKNFEETQHLYNLKGQRVLPGDYKSIGVNWNDADDKANVFLIYAEGSDDSKSIYIYDKRLKKISGTIIENAKSLQVEEGMGNNSLSYIYLDKSGTGKRIIVKFGTDAITVVSDTVINFHAEKRKMEEHWYGESQMDRAYDERESAAPPVNSADEQIILTVREIKESRDFYYLPKKVEEIHIKTLNLKKNERYIVSRNNKQGLFLVHNKSFLIPVMYDEIIWGEFPGLYGGHILRNGTKYGAILRANKTNKVIEPVFDKLPLVADTDYFGEMMPLFKLYDDNGKLFCYADETGKLFYKP